MCWVHHNNILNNFFYLAFSSISSGLNALSKIITEDIRRFSKPRSNRTWLNFGKVIARWYYRWSTRNMCKAGASQRVGKGSNRTHIDILKLCKIFVISKNVIWNYKVALFEICRVFTQAVHTWLFILIHSNYLKST